MGSPVRVLQLSCLWMANYREIEERISELLDDVDAGVHKFSAKLPEGRTFEADSSGDAATIVLLDKEFREGESIKLTQRLDNALHVASSIRIPDPGGTSTLS